MAAPRRRALLSSALLASTAVLGAGCSALGGSSREQAGATKGATRSITDVLGRTLTVPAQPTRIMLGGQRDLYTTALLNKENPLDKVLAWPKDLLDNDPGTYRTYVKKFPALEKIPRIGEVWDGSFNLEHALQLRPEVFVISASSFEDATQKGIVSGLEKAGVPTVVTDFFVDPVTHTVPSMRIMGTLFGREKQAQAFIDFYEKRAATIRDRLAQRKPEPTRAFLWRAPGYFECCATFKQSNLAKLVTAAGGRSIGDSLLKAEQGRLSPEAVAAAKPQVILATGADWSAAATPATKGSFVPLGYSESAADAAAAWKRVIDEQPVLRASGHVAAKRAFAAWHHFYDSPYNILALEWFAKALHPELFADLDPQATFRELHETFLPVPAQGTFWTGLP